MKKFFSAIITILFYALVFAPIWFMLIYDVIPSKPSVLVFLYMSGSVLASSCIVIDVISKWVVGVIESKS